MITIDHTIKEPSSLGFLYSPTDECIGEIENELQLYDVQIQICTQNLDGYYIKWKDERLDIRNNGEISKWPENFCDKLSVHLLNFIVHAWQSKVKNLQFSMKQIALGDIHGEKTKQHYQKCEEIFAIFDELSL